MDHGLLLSTTAASAAALVAIVGGFLVSRVISLATERSGLEARRDDVQTQLRLTEQRHGDLADRLLRREVQEVLWAGQDAFARGDKPLDIEAMIYEADVARTVNEVRPYVDKEAARFDAIREHLRPLFKDGRPAFDLQDVMQSGKLEIERTDEAAYQAAWDALVKQTPKRPGHVFDFNGMPIPDIGIDWQTVGAIHDTAAESELATLRRDTEQARHQIDVLKIQLDQTELALARIARPQGVIKGMWVLAYVTVAGTFLPLTLMASGIKSMDWRGASAVVGLFGSGMVLLMGYLLREVRSLALSPSDPVSG